MKVFFVMSLLFLIISTSCSSKKKSPVEVEWTKEKSMELNKTIAMEEKVAIKLFLAQHSTWKMMETGSGLQYYIYEKGSGDMPKVGSVVEIEYSIKMLDGTLCYETAKDEVIVVVIDHSDVETGVQEGLKKMKVGDRAKMIIPSHLAHGLTGDLDKIKPLTPIIVDIYLNEIIK
jgi:FKBP-type peptidyl-prolyl cis-trans isomerase